MDWKVKFTDDTDKIAKAFRRATYQALQRLGFMIRSKAQASIEDEKGPSEPGTPPHTHRRVTTKSGKPGHKGLLPASILYGLDKESMSVLIGPSVNVIGTSMSAMEHGGEYQGVDSPPRPFMGPALGEEIGELPGLLSEQFGKV